MVFRRGLGTLAVLLGSLFGLAYLLYSPARVAEAIDRASRDAGLTATYSMAFPRRPGSALVRNFTVSHPQHAWSLHVGAVEVKLAPVLGGPRHVRIDLLERSVRLHSPELAWESTLSGQLRLAGLENSSLNALRTVEFTGRDGVLRIGDHAARSLTVTLRLAETKPGALNGSITVRGVARSKLLQQLGVRPKIRALFQSELDASFEFRSILTLTAAQIRLDDLTGSWGEASFEGRFAWYDSRADCSLRVTTPTHRVGLSLVGDEALVESVVDIRETILDTPRPAPSPPRPPSVDG